MVTKKNDNNSFAPYKHNAKVEAVVDKSFLDFWQTRLDKALDERMFLSNPVEFQKIVDSYLEAKKVVDSHQD